MVSGLGKDFFRERLFRPHGVTNIGFRISERDALESRKELGFREWVFSKIGRAVYTGYCKVWGSVGVSDKQQGFRGTQKR